MVGKPGRPCPGRRQAVKTILAIQHRMPHAVQNALISAYGLYLQHHRYGGPSRRFFRELVSNESLTAAEMDDLVLRLLRERAVLALTRVPAYASLRERLEEVRQAQTCEEILSVFPVLEKEAIRLRPESFVPGGLSSKLLRANTSGTTGTPLTLFRTEEGTRRCFAFFRRVRRWRGLTHRNRTATLMGRPLVPIDRDRPPFWRSSWFTRDLFLSSYHMSPQTLPGYVRRVRRFRPEQIVCYPSSGFLLARAVLESGEPLQGVRAVFTTAETLSAEQRSLMEQALGCPVADQYGSGEWTVWISQCELGTYHLHPDFGYMEVHDSGGRRVSSGSGRCVATGFINDAMVLMRYDTGDDVRLDGRSCDCGRAFPTVAAVEGRSDDFIETPDGRLVGRLDHVFKELSGIVECQLVQRRLDTIEALVVPGQGWGDAARSELSDELTGRLGRQMKVEISTVASIARTENGKFRAVIGLDRR